MRRACASATSPPPPLPTNPPLPFILQWLNATGGVDRLEDIFYNGDLIKSSDGGLSFQRMNIYPPGEGPVLSVDNVQTNGDGSALVATATVSSGYYVDNDEGTVLQGLRTSWLWSTGDSPDLIVTYTSVDGGATWVPSTIGGFSPSVSDLFLFRPLPRFQASRSYSVPPAL